MLQGGAIKHFRKLQSTTVKFFIVERLSLLLYLLGIYHQPVKSTMASFIVTLLTLSITETVWWKRQLGGVIIRNKSQIFLWGRLPMASLLLKSVHGAKIKKSPSSSFFLKKAYLSFFSFCLCLKYRTSIVWSHFLLRYVWNYLKGRWHSHDHPQWSLSPKTACGTQNKEAKETDGVYGAHRTSALTLRVGGLRGLAASPNRTVFHWLTWTLLSLCCLYFPPSTPLKCQWICSWLFHSSVLRCLPWCF